MIPQDLEFKISGKLVPSLIAIPNVELKDYTLGLSAFLNEHVSQARCLLHNVNSYMFTRSLRQLIHKKYSLGQLNGGRPRYDVDTAGFDLPNFWKDLSVPNRDT